MNKLYTIRLLKIISIINCVILLFYCYIPKRSWAISDMNYTVGENRVDVLCVGSSHVFQGINPVQMYEEEGIAAYDIAIGSQAPWQSYYYIKEACKCQKPKIIIFDTFMVGATQGEDYYKDYMTVNNLVDCPLSVNKILAVLASTADSKIDILLNFPYSHDYPYTGISLNKIKGNTDYLLGYKYNIGVGEYRDVIDACDVIEKKNISKKDEDYLRRIIKYCQANNIALILTNTPWPEITEKTQMRFNYIAAVAEEYGVPFIDGCKLYEEMHIDYSTDCTDKAGHLNDSGVSKYTAWLEKYIKENYDLPDRRNDKYYYAYNTSIEYLENVRNE